ncbi:MAG: hypothetical protein II852_12690 [Bacteroidales bacterium]|nr:hypothetical protein [Bacteroidales bacterium]
MRLMEGKKSEKKVRNKANKKPTVPGLVGFQFGAVAVQSYSHAASTGLAETLKKCFNAANIDTFFNIAKFFAQLFPKILPFKKQLLP